MTLTQPSQHAREQEVRAPRSLARVVALVGPLAIAVAVQSAANLIFHGTVGRWLDASSYGALGALLALITMLAVPLSALQAASSTLTASTGRTKATVRRALSRATLWAVLLTGLVAAASAPIASFFHVSTFNAMLLAPFVGVSVVLAVSRGLLLGDSRTGVVASSYLVSAGLRLGPGLALAAFYGVTGALVGTLIGELSALAVTSGVSLRSCAVGTLNVLRVRPVLTTTVVVTGLFVFSTADLLLARHFLPGSGSGVYVAAATVGKTVLAIPAAVVSAMYPRFVSAWTAGGRATALRNGLVVIAAPAIAAGAIIALAPHLVMSVLYGSHAMPGSSPVVRSLALIAAATSIVSALTYAALARRSKSMLIPWLGAAFEITLIAVWHSSPFVIAMCSAAALLPTIIVLGVLELRAWRD